MSRELDVAVEAAKRAGEISMKHFRRPMGISMKPDDTPLTAADKESERAIIETIRKSFPNHSFLSEEAGEQQAGGGFTWVIDPLDGTRGYSRGLSTFGVSIALRKGNEIILGVMLMPAAGELFTAEAGKGAYLNGKRIRVSDTGSLEKVVVCFDATRRLLSSEENCLKLMKVGRKAYAFKVSDSVDCLGNLAAGRIDLYVSLHTKPWDIAAAKVVIEEAGGRLTDLNGNNSIDSGNCVASNGKIHGEILEILGGG
jgi:histidinol phosphatase-like enzyme (inositol monophosphatase family)